MTPLYEGELPTGGFAPLSEALDRMALRLWIPGADDKVSQEEFEKAILTVEASYRDQATAAWEIGRAKCESPIEKLILPWLICQRYQFFDYFPSVLLPGETEKYVRGTLSVVPQLPISGYRVDFALAASLGGPIRFVVIECDGEQFHGESNANRDAQRDEAILRNQRVLAIARIKSKEIFDNPQGAGLLAAKAVLQAWRR